MIVDLMVRPLLAAALLVAPATPAPPTHAVHTAGRVVADGAVLRYSWPGVYLEGRFRGTGVGIVLDDADNDYDVAVDGVTVATLVKPGAITHRVTGLTPGTHTVRVVKRTESPWTSGAFGGFVPVAGGTLLSAPRPRPRQIEFIGDSYTAGYGNESATRDCAGDEVHRTTNADRSFGALAARELGADYQLNAFSGRGMVRNYNGGEPGTSYRTYYERALLAVDGDVWQRPRTWRPQLVVVGLGINDFSTAINPGEPWTPESRAEAYRVAYHGFLDTLRARYGERTIIVVSSTDGAPGFPEAAARVVAERTDRVRLWHYPGTGLDYGGCHWHPSLADHALIATRLESFVDTLPLRW
ncbi:MULTISPECIES: SGNH/GDSL hydrolase family protein [Catenuloplanes]|uniref:Lysophospholipase L1-like esterase n=1 Tax=Catenuloplanes niger TaxID=587534 RepID=A0AAE4CXZ3_9ACTN|nr:SGNH/GDSL hydrolase family protein [Catenuloplanes niger]MDR7327118.1 lysophospholipase L1-like esterase [Catenuloplanes niger]